MSIEDDTFASEPTHHVAMAVRSVVCGVADLNEIDADELEDSDVVDLVMAQSRLHRILDAVLQKKAA